MQTKLFTTLIMFLAISWSLTAQTSLRVNQILQEKCAGCHGVMSPAANLDLSGDVSAMMSSLVDVTPANAHAASEGYALIYPGRADKSYLFRLVQDGMEPFIEMDAAEMPATPHNDEALGLTDTEKELIRQWILYGARVNGTVVEESLLEDYYTNGGMESFPDGRPVAPDPSEGFQIKMGPFFLEAGSEGEVEYFQKYELDNEQPVEITRIDNFMDGNSSHHFILYDYNSADAASYQQAGLRLNPDHINVGLVEAVQDPTDLILPEGTAFFWSADKVLDLNSHYINYHSVPYKSEVYANIYYQESGIAAQEMHAELVPKTNICIPNNGDLYTRQQTIFDLSLGEIYVWALSGHTHQLGRGYKIWKREDGEAGELIYDAACYGGEPGCVSPYYDYRHIPFRYFDDLLPVNMGFVNGIIHEAAWVNDTDQVVCWGDTSDDEMMVMILMYLEELDGVTDVENPETEIDILNAYPNPMTENAIIQLPEDTGTVDLILYDVLGNQIRAMRDISNTQITIERGNLPAGMYVYHLKNEAGKLFSGKILMQ